MAQIITFYFIVLSFLLLKYLCVIFLKTFHSCLSKLFIGPERSAVSEDRGVSRSHDEVGGAGLSDGESVVGLGGFSSGLEFALVSDFVAVLGPLGLVLALRLGLVNGLSSLEAELARGSVVSDDRGVVDLSLVQGLGDGVEREGRGLGEDVEGFEFNVNAVVLGVNSELGTVGVTVLEVVEDGVGL